MTRSIALLLLCACGGAAPIAAEKPGPRGMRADQHLAMASREDDRATQLDTWPDRPVGIDGPDAHLITVAWTGRWDTAEEHRRLARTHRSAAAEINAEYEEACGTTAADLVETSPLERYGIGGNATERGATVILSGDAGPPARLLGELRCHRAWMMLGRSDMDDCPLDLKGLHVYAHGDAKSIELDLTVDDPKLIPELQRRTAHDLEMASHRVKAESSSSAP